MSYIIPLYELNEWYNNCKDLQWLIYYKSLNLVYLTINSPLQKNYNLNSKLPLVAYAPTGVRIDAYTKSQWIETYGSISGYQDHGSHFIKDKIIKNTKKANANIIELPHPCVERSKELDSNRIDVLIAADILVSDISSMAIEYLSMDKPIILIKKPIQDSLPNDFKMFNQIGYPILDIWDIISVSELNRTIQYRLKNDDYKKVWIWIT